MQQDHLITAVIFVIPSIIKLRKRLKFFCKCTSVTALKPGLNRAHFGKITGKIINTDAGINNMRHASLRY